MAAGTRSVDVNRVLHALREGRTVVGGQISTGVPWLPAAFAQAGLDFVWLDLEHSLLDLGTIAGHIQACRLAGIVPMVRTPGLDISLIRRLLDNGAQGIVVPFVEDAHTAAEAVRACRFHPFGYRGAADPLIAHGFHPVSMAEHVALDDSETIVCIQIESQAGVVAVNEIAAVPGLDLVSVGLTDLSISLGRPGDYDNDDITAAVRSVIQACSQHGVAVGIGGSYGGGDAGERFVAWQSEGIRSFSVVIDIVLLSAGLRARAATMLRALRPEA